MTAVLNKRERQRILIEKLRPLDEAWRRCHSDQVQGTMDFLFPLLDQHGALTLKPREVTCEGAAKDFYWRETRTIRIATIRDIGLVTRAESVTRALQHIFPRETMSRLCKLAPHGHSYAAWAHALFLESTVQQRLKETLGENLWNQRFVLLFCDGDVNASLGQIMIRSLRYFFLLVTALGICGENLARLVHLRNRFASGNYPIGFEAPDVPIYLCSTP